MKDRQLIFAGMSPFGSMLRQVLDNTQNPAGDVSVLNYLDDQDFQTQLAVVEPAQEYVVLLDSLTTPACIAMQEWAKDKKALLIAGSNVPMAIDALYLLHDVDSLEELGQSLCAEGKSSISAVQD